jgi:DHA1 family tetracycline resistance protein-like MFS transporter
VTFLALVAFSGFEGTFALFGARRLGLHETSTYVVFTIIGLVIALDQVAVVHPVVARYGERQALLAGLVLNAAGLALVPLAHSDVGLAPSLLLLCLGEGLITPTLSSIVAGRASVEGRGQALGIQQSAGGLGRTIGPAVAGFAFGHIGVWSPYAGGAALVAGAAVVFAAAVT